MNVRFPLLCLLATLLLSRPTESAVVVRMGTLAPSGSSWELILRRMGVEWGQSTDGELRLRIYAGGTVGDE
ncbi:MAG: C4-dicarboxylate ABC transporter substrate-binding protein, partial [Actinobacteria bacterium]|nr:C4-dicarboxylate ABC transporter substrate-binding protein [Actinomycetota bacterium]